MPNFSNTILMLSLSRNIVNKYIWNVLTWTSSNSPKQTLLIVYRESLTVRMACALLVGRSLWKELLQASSKLTHYEWQTKLWLEVTGLIVGRHFSCSVSLECFLHSLEVSQVDSCWETVCLLFWCKVLLRSPGWYENSSIVYTFLETPEILLPLSPKY